MRLSPAHNERLTQCAALEKQIGGAELNVAAGVVNLGLSAGIISKIPQHMIGNYAEQEIRKNGVCTEYLAKDKESDARLGLYYYE